jgi:hypothetical protein
VFLDPPYETGRGNLYTHEVDGLAQEVNKWCVAHGNDPKLRIVLAGMQYEHENLEALGWRVLSAIDQGPKGAMRGGYGKAREINRLDRLWLSPNCLPLGK